MVSRRIGGNGVIMAFPKKGNIMSILEKIKADQLQARKDKNTVAKDLLTTLIGEIENKSRRPDTKPGFEYAVVKSFMDKVVEFEALTTDQSVKDRLNAEKAILEQYTPKMVSEADLVAAIRTVVPDGKMTAKDRGPVMKHLKEQFQERLDAAAAMRICREQFEI